MLLLAKGLEQRLEVLAYGTIQTKPLSRAAIEGGATEGGTSDLNDEGQTRRSGGKR